MNSTFIAENDWTLNKNVIIFDKSRYYEIKDNKDKLLIQARDKFIKLSSVNIYFSKNKSGNIVRLSSDLSKSLNIDIDYDILHIIDENAAENIYIIGSLSQADEIKDIANRLLDFGNIRYVKPEPDKTFAKCVQTCFDNIEWANIIHVITKPDGSLGEGVTYEVEYAKRLCKTIHIHNIHDTEFHMVEINEYPKEE